MITYASGNVFNHNFLDDKNYIIPHICNDIGKFGSGFAKYLLDNYPIVAREYSNWYNNRNRHEYNDLPFELGQIQYVNIKNNIKICNMIAQHKILTLNKKPIRYTSLIKCMEKIKLYIIDQLEKGNDIEIVCPMFGSGLAGGNWNFIVELIDEIWQNVNITVYDFSKRD